MKLSFSLCSIATTSYAPDWTRRAMNLFFRIAFLACITAVSAGCATTSHSTRSSATDREIAARIGKDMDGSIDLIMRDGAKLKLQNAQAKDGELCGTELRAGPQCYRTDTINQVVTDVEVFDVEGSLKGIADKALTTFLIVGLIAVYALMGAAPYM